MNKKRTQKYIYEYIKGREYVKELKKQPIVSSFELVELLSKKN